LRLIIIAPRRRGASALPQNAVAKSADRLDFEFDHVPVCQEAHVFTVGAAIGLFGWGSIIASVGWREGLLIGAGVGLATLILMFVLFPTPPSSSGEVLQGEHLGPESLRRVFGNSTLWIMGFALLGGYGSYFSAAQLLPHYAQSTLDIDAGTAEAISVILLVSRIPGAFIGWLTDRALGAVPTFLAALVLEAIAFLLIPYLGLHGVEIAAAIIGAAGIAAFVPFVTIPGQQGSVFHISDIPTAVGLMLTIAAVGGAVVPPLFSRIASDFGFQAAWSFEGVISLGFARLALVARSTRAVAVAPAIRAGG